MGILKLSAANLSRKIRSKELKATEVYEAYWNQAHKWNPKFNAILNWNEQGIEMAKAIDRRIQANQEVGILAGIPMGIKDMLCTRGIKTTAGSKILANFIPPYSSTVVNLLEAAGAIVQSKLNQDEFAMGSSNETSFFGPCKNPWNADYVPGGSSGGSAAAVSACMSAAAIGTDTGGSIRQPAHFCGIVGLKPTYGRVSRYGIVAFASSLDQAGPMTKTVEDAALVLEAIAGKDPHDSTTANLQPEPWSQNLRSDLKGIKIGIPREYMPEDLNPEIRKAMELAKEALLSAGATFVDVELPNLEMAVPVYYLIATSEASSNLARYDGVRFGFRSDFSKEPAESIEDFFSRTRGEGFGEEVKRRILMGTFCLSSGYYDAYYLKAGQVRSIIRQEFRSVFERCDALLAPVANSAAFKLNERVRDPLTMYLNDIYTTSANLAGIPALSVPVMNTSAGLPVGVQLMGNDWQEKMIIDVGHVLEKNLEQRRKNNQEIFPNVF